MPFLALSLAGGILAAEPPIEPLEPLGSRLDVRADLGQRTLLVCAEGKGKADLVEKPLAWAYDDPREPNEQFVKASGITNELKYRLSGLGLDGLEHDRWYGISALRPHPLNRDPEEMKLFKRAARTLGCVLKTTGAKVASGDLVRYHRLVDSIDRIGLYGLLDGPDRYWPAIYAEAIGNGYYKARLRVFDTLEKRWSAPETLGTEAEPLDECAFYPIGRGLQLLYTIRKETVREEGAKPARRSVSGLRTFRSATGEFRAALATQWTMGMHLFDLDGDGFFEYGATRAEGAYRGYVPKTNGLVWQDSLQGYADIKKRRGSEGK